MNKSEITNPLARESIEEMVTLNDIKDLGDTYWYQLLERFPESIKFLLQLAHDKGGRDVYVPAYSSLIRLARDRAIQEGLVEREDLHISKRHLQKIKPAQKKGAFD